ncbi:MAG TPA: GNAT family N-acetyltransferase [Oligoflexus sp.]|uniref:GNAT family N-acetyltransferase n=1 Tax=Oligoflexus sp. TaxID=1971216 RepID=UPI002D7E4153|nr:GNAT family N-acetyltransferase [Oligoflexus sp.]HET9236829.1 GNAT family N-acetyltransferase [Oligoflexus sp.]
MSAQYPALIALPMPILTPRLVLRPPQAGDGPAYYAAINASREHLRRFLPWVDASHLTQEDSENMARLCHAKYLARTDIVLPFFDRKTQQLCGSSGMHRMDWSVPSFEIGYWVHKDHEGQGLVTEAVHAVTRYAFEQLQASRVEIRCERDNTRSRAVAERLGFERDGILRHDRRNSQSGELTDTWVYSRLNMAGLPDLEVSW